MYQPLKSRAGHWPPPVLGVMPWLGAMLVALVLASCVNQAIDPAYEINEERTLPGAVAIPPPVRPRLEGTYLVVGAVRRFGDTVVLKWGGDGLSMFCGNTAYAYTNGGMLDSAVQMVGYWRNAATLVTGDFQLQITNRVLIRALMDSTLPVPKRLTIEGSYSDGLRATPDQFSLQYLAPLPVPTRPFLIIGHRAGGRNSDYHPVSENTPGMARFAERLGANAVEIDIRLTRDNVPVIFHDENISTRLVQQGSLIGPVSNYTLEQLRTFARLVRGERIPTLREMLDTVLLATRHQFVYLDIKTADVIPLIAPIQDEYRARAAALGRQLEILIAITSDEVQSAFTALGDYRSRPSLNELGPDQVESTNSVMWSPRWTQGILTSDIARVHAAGRRAIVWTLDDPKFIRSYITQGDYDGILTNYPGMVAYEYYMRGVK